MGGGVHGFTSGFQLPSSSSPAHHLVIQERKNLWHPQTLRRNKTLCTCSANTGSQEYARHYIEPTAHLAAEFRQPGVAAILQCCSWGYNRSPRHLPPKHLSREQQGTAPGASCRLSLATEHQSSLSQFLGAWPTHSPVRCNCESRHLSYCRVDENG